MRYNQGPVSTLVKKMPEFLVQKGDRVHFVEVKYKGDGNYSISDLDKDNKTYPYEDCIIILVTKDKIKSLSVKDLRSNKRITPDCENYLGRRSESNLDRGIISDYLQIVRIFFGNIPSKLEELKRD